MAYCAWRCLGREAGLAVHCCAWSGVRASALCPHLCEGSMLLGLGITEKRCPARSVEKTDRAHVASAIIRKVDGSGGFPLPIWVLEWVLLRRVGA